MDEWMDVCMDGYIYISVPINDLNIHNRRITVFIYNYNLLYLPLGVS